MTKLHDYHLMMRYLTRPAPDPSIKQLAKQIPQYGSPGTYGESFFEEDMPNIQDLIREEGIQVGQQVKDGGRVGMKPGGLVEPGVTHYATLTEAEKLANTAKWKKANPDLKFEDLRASTQSKIRSTGDTGLGTFRKKLPNTYTIKELANIEGMPYSLEALKRKLNVRDDKKFLKALKDAGIEIPSDIRKGWTIKVKMVDPEKSMRLLTDYAVNSDYIPSKLFEPYIKQIPSEYKKLVESGKPFSMRDLRKAVAENVGDLPYKLNLEKNDGTHFNAKIRETLTKPQLKKFSIGTILEKEERLLPRKQIIESLLDGKSNIKHLQKISDLSEKEVGEHIQKIFRGIYDSKTQIGAKQTISNIALKNYNLDDLEKILKIINKEPTLDSYFQQSYRELLFDAFGDPRNKETYQPKKFARALKRLEAYNNINKELFEQFGIKLNLDHSLPKVAIKSFKDFSPEQLIRVNPIPQEINLGIKKSFDIRYKNILTDLQDSSITGEARKKLIQDKIKVEKLAKDIGLPFGKISPAGKIIDYNAVDFLNKNLGKEIKSGVTLTDKIVQNVQILDKSGDLETTVKQIFGNKSNVYNSLKNLKPNNPQTIKNIMRALRFLITKGKSGLKAEADNLLNVITGQGVEDKRYASASMMSDVGDPYVKDEASMVPEFLTEHPILSAAGAGTSYALSKPKGRALAMNLLKGLFETKSKWSGLWGIEPPLMMASEVAAHEGSIKNLEENLKNVGLFGTKVNPETRKQIMNYYRRKRLEKEYGRGLELGVGDELLVQDPGYKFQQDFAKGVESWGEKPDDFYNMLKYISKDQTSAKAALEPYLKSERIRRREDIGGSLEGDVEDIRPYPVYDYNIGGRVPFIKGKIVKGVDEGRRAFLQWLAGITGATVAAGTGLLKWGAKKGAGTTAIKAGDKIIQGTPGMPDWFIPLINRIVKEGDDVTKKLGTVEREIVHSKKIAQGEEVTVYQNLDTGNVRVDYTSPHNMGEGIGPVSLEYKAPQVIDEGKHAGKKTNPEFEAYEPEPVGYTHGPDDYSIEWDGTNIVGRAEDLVSDTSKLKQFATKKKPTMGEIVTRKKKIDEVDAIHKNESDYIATKQGEGDWDDYLPDIDDMDY